MPRMNGQESSTHRATLAAAVWLVLLLAVAWPVAAQDLVRLRAEIDRSVPWDPWPLKLAPQDKIIYGNDDRIDVYEESDPARLRWAASTCGLFDASDVTLNSNGTFSIQTYSYTNFGVPACPDEPFGNQPLSAFCSGFMVGPDLIATAGHCINPGTLRSTVFIFGYQMLDANTPVTTFDRNQVYAPVEVVDWALIGDLDHAVLRVDRPITSPGAVSLPIRREGVVPNGTRIGAIGHPTGLPLKLAFGEESIVLDNSPEAYFTTNLDVYGGNSGSPTFNAETGVVEGIVVRGRYPEFSLNGNCFNSVVLPVEGVPPIYEESAKTIIFAESVPEDGVAEGQFFLRATPTETLGGDPVVALTWVNPPADQYDRAVLVRRLDRFARSTEEGERLFTGRQQQFLDTNVQLGLKYFYTLFVETAEGGSRVSFASAEVSGEPVSALSEGFGPDPVTGLFKPLDLSFSQITFTPVGAPSGAPGSSAATGTYADYEATVRTDMQRLPVAREDTEGKAISLNLMEDAALRVSFQNARFPYFGRQYSTIYIAANGYISFADYSAVPQLNFPSVQAHFAVPRISALFSDLAPSIGGSIWMRVLPDRLVVTYENMPEYRVDSGIAPPGGNTLQVELYLSGQIRFTYLGLAARQAFVGLSDGRGIPVDPATVFNNVRPVDFFVDFSGLAPSSNRLAILPIALPRAEAGQTVSFPVRTRAAGGVPVLYAEWNREGAVPFADEGDGTGQFEWRTRVADSGTTIVRFFALLDDEIAYQDVRIVVGPAVLLPEATDLRLSTNTPFEDPSRNRPVADDRPLLASYTYSHPQLSGNAGQHREGPSILYWYRNGLLVPAFTNQRSVPAAATRPGDRWQFQVIPVSASFISGRQATSPIVTIMGYPTIASVSPGVGLVTGGQTVRIRGTRLNGATSVTIGGVEVAGLRTLSPEEIEIVTPVRAPGLFDVVVTTVHGVARAPKAFQYVNDLSEVINPDVNGDGKVDALDVQLVLNVLLAQKDAKSVPLADVNGDGRVNATDLQLVVGAALRR